MDEVIDFIMTNDVALIGLLLALFTAVKQFLGKLEDVSTPGWFATVIKVLRKVLEYITANDGKTDSE